MKQLIVFIIFCAGVFALAKAQSITSQEFTVNGDFDKFYPVAFTDASWNNGATELEITRADVHTNSLWRGALVAKFRFHTTRWGHGAHFADADIRKSVVDFIADWKDGTRANASYDMIIWLRGGGTTYYMRSVNSTMGLPKVYDGVQNPLPFQEENGPEHTCVTTVNPKINTNGLTYGGSAYFNGDGYFGGNLGIGVVNPQNALDVNGTIRSREIVVDNTGWADYVFHPSYRLKPLAEVEQYIKTHGHLENIPTAKEVEEEGVNIGDIEKKLLEKLEQLTLYAIEQNKKLQEQEQRNAVSDKKLDEYTKQNTELKQEIEQLKQLINQKLK